MNEHLRRIKNKECQEHYLSKRIQNELISLVAQKTTDAIADLIKRAKYFTVIMDCTPDKSHMDQLSIVMRIVNCEANIGISIEEHFVGFVDVHNTTGKGLYDTFINHLNKLQLNISDCRGQGPVCSLWQPLPKSGHWRCSRALCTVNELLWPSPKTVHPFQLLCAMMGDHAGACTVDCQESVNNQMGVQNRQCQSPPVSNASICASLRGTH